MCGQVAHENKPSFFKKNKESGDTHDFCSG